MAAEPAANTTAPVLQAVILPSMEVVSPAMVFCVTSIAAKSVVIAVCLTSAASSTASNVSILLLVAVINASTPSRCPMIVSCFADTAAPVGSAQLVTSTSPMSTPLFAASLPMAAEPAANTTAPVLQAVILPSMEVVSPATVPSSASLAAWSTFAAVSSVSNPSTCPMTVSCLPSMLVRLASRATRSV